MFGPVGLWTSLLPAELIQPWRNGTARLLAFPDAGRTTELLSRTRFTPSDVF
jgi:hypothetical protein